MQDYSCMPLDGNTYVRLTCTFLPAAPSGNIVATLHRIPDLPGWFSVSDISDLACQPGYAVTCVRRPDALRRTMAGPDTVAEQRDDALRVLVASDLESAAQRTTSPWDRAMVLALAKAFQSFPIEIINDFEQADAASVSELVMHEVH